MQNLKEFFLLRDDICYLNFGSYGACVKPVFEHYQKVQLEIEREPAQFFNAAGRNYLAAARKALSYFIHCFPDDIVYVTNPSYAVNAIAKSFPLKPGDEVLSTDLEYGSCQRTWDYYCNKAGAHFVKQKTVWPIQSKEEFVSGFFKGLTERTKLVFLSHITSSTGLRLPVEEICAIAKEKGIMTFIDGAHVPGQLPLNLQDSNFDIYAGACHKWMMTPKGSSFLYVKKEYQDFVDPLVVSWGYNPTIPSPTQFLDYHQMNGTRDYSAFLTIPTAINFMKEHNWTEVAAACHKMVIENAEAFCALLGSMPIAPISDDFVAQLYSAEVITDEPEKLQQCLFETYKIEIPVMRHGDKKYMRISINAFNDQRDLDKLFNALRTIKKETSLIQ